MKFEKRTEEEEPRFQIAPLIDIVFLTLIFFMSASVYYQLETELDIKIPTASASQPMERTLRKIIVNIGPPPSQEIVVNQRQLSISQLTELLRKISEISKGEAVIIRADKRTRYQRVVQVLNACAKADIWNISFATVKEERR